MSEGSEVNNADINWALLSVCVIVCVCIYTCVCVCVCVSLSLSLYINYNAPLRGGFRWGLELASAVQPDNKTFSLVKKSNQHKFTHGATSIQNVTESAENT